MPGYDSEFFQNNKDKYAKYGARYRDGLKMEMIEAYGGKCSNCPESDPDCLCLDHINDDAHVEKELYGVNARGGHKHYARLKAQGWPKDRFQLLCFNCNAKKEHKRRREGIATAEYADRTLAQARRGPQPSNTSGFKGVFWDKQKHKWTARIMIDYKTKHLGFFDDRADAACAYRVAAIAQWGEDANVPSLEEIDRIAAEMEAPVEPLDVSAEELGL